jgi:hypothetical protein
MLCIVPIAYVVLKCGGPAWSAFAVYLGIIIIAFFANLHIVLPMISLRLTDFLKHAIRRCALVTLLSLIVPVAMMLFTEPSLLSSVIDIIVTIICTTVLSFFFGFEQEERRLILEKVRAFISKRMRNKNSNKKQTQ